MGWAVARWPGRRSAVASISCLSPSRATEAVWLVGQGRDMASRLPSVLRHSRYQCPSGAFEQKLTVGVGSLRWGSGPGMCAGGWALRTRTRKSRVASDSSSVGCRPDSRRLWGPVVATSQPSCHPGSGGRGHPLAGRPAASACCGTSI